MEQLRVSEAAVWLGKDTDLQTWLTKNTEIKANREREMVFNQRRCLYLIKESPPSAGEKMNKGEIFSNESLM